MSDLITKTPVFLPVNKKLSFHDQRLRAEQFRDQLIELLNESGPMGSTDLVKATGRSINTVREYMSKLIKAGRARSVVVANPINGGATVMAIYSSVSEADQPDEPQQSVKAAYPLHHFRDPFVAALFGPARV